MFGKLKRRIVAAGIILTAAYPGLLAPAAYAQGAILTGRVMLVEGHESLVCRRLLLRLDGGTEVWFRLPDTGTDNSILAVGLTAIATGKKTNIAYTPGVGTGCGGEPKINYISLLAE